jgi:SAM-dependent methyltransferase
MKHITLLMEAGLQEFPTTVAELGPGDTLGLGLAALLSGANSYFGLDIVEHTTRHANGPVLRQLVDMMLKRAPRPILGWPNFDPFLDQQLFPSHILTEDRLLNALAPDRVDRISRALLSNDGRCDEIDLRYRVPWDDTSVIEENTVDLIISHAVLEHVVDLRKTYLCLFRWLRPGGRMSHQIDFRSHNLTREWNGYRAISEPVWKVMMGRRPYLINRVPPSAHLELMAECGFQISYVARHERTDGIARSRLAKRWRELSDEDMNCDDLFVQAVKPS